MSQTQRIAHPFGLITSICVVVVVVSMLMWTTRAVIELSRGHVTAVSGAAVLAGGLVILSFLVNLLNLIRRWPRVDTPPPAVDLTVGVVAGDEPETITPAKLSGIVTQSEIVPWSETENDENRGTDSHAIPTIPPSSIEHSPTPLTLPISPCKCRTDKATDGLAVLLERRAVRAEQHIEVLRAAIKKMNASHTEIMTMARNTAELQVKAAVMRIENIYSERRERRLDLAEEIETASRGFILYRFFDDDDDLLYIGITENIRRRVRQHQDSKSWWPDVAGVSLEYFPTRIALAAAERDAIITEDPRHNITYAGVRR